MEYNFDEIRPYYDYEVNEAIQRILKNDNFAYFLNKYILNSNRSEEDINQIRNIDSIFDFQAKISRNFIKKIIAHSIKDFETTGLDNINKTDAFLFISNHRDIVLDSALLQFILFENGIHTTQSAIGNNLVITDLLKDIAKLNKMFLVKRDGNARELIENSHILSTYIFESIQQKQSVWIAQRNGRTKNGIDATQNGLIKMLSLASKGNITNRIRDLNIVPISISYEFESCDYLKAREVSLTQNGKYEKQTGEDLLSIETGIMQPKGRVSLAIGNPLNASYETWGKLEGNDNDIIKEIALCIDKIILNNYKLFPNNYIAADYICNSQKYASFYTHEEKLIFENHLNANIQKSDVDKDIFKDNFLNIYANPVFQKENMNIAAN